MESGPLSRPPEALVGAFTRVARGPFPFGGLGGLPGPSFLGGPFGFSRARSQAVWALLSLPSYRSGSLGGKRKAACPAIPSNCRTPRTVAAMSPLYPPRFSCNLQRKSRQTNRRAALADVRPQSQSAMPIGPRAAGEVRCRLALERAWLRSPRLERKLRWRFRRRKGSLDSLYFEWEI